MKYLMVLNDGETFSDLDGCYVLQVPDDWDEDSVKEMPIDEAPVYCHPVGFAFYEAPITMHYNSVSLQIDMPQ